MRYKSLTFSTLAQVPTLGPVQRFGSLPGPSILDREFSRVKMRYLSGYVAWHEPRTQMGFFIPALFVAIAAAAAAIVAAIIAAIAAAIAFVLATILIPLGVSAALVATVSAAVTGLVVAKLLTAVGLPPWASTVLGVLTGAILIPDLSALTSPKELINGALSPLENADLGTQLSALSSEAAPSHDVGQAFLAEGGQVEQAASIPAVTQAEALPGSPVAELTPVSDAVTLASFPTQKAGPFVPEAASPEVKAASAGVLAQMKSALPGVNLSKLDPKDILALGLSLLSPKKKKLAPPPGAQIVYEYEYYYPDGGEAERRIVPRIVYPTPWGMIAGVGAALSLIGGGLYLKRKGR